MIQVISIQAIQIDHFKHNRCKLSDKSHWHLITVEMMNRGCISYVGKHDHAPDDNTLIMQSPLITQHTHKCLAYLEYLKRVLGMIFLKLSDSRRQTKLPTGHVFRDMVSKLTYKYRFSHSSSLILLTLKHNKSFGFKININKKKKRSVTFVSCHTRRGSVIKIYEVMHSFEKKRHS